MTMALLKSVISLAFLLLVLCLYVSCTNVTCTAGAFDEGSAASVVCNFGRDVNVTKRNFNVMHYADLESSTGNYILLCNWLDNGNIQCTVEGGYSFNYTVGMGLTLHIPVLKKAMAGSYVCHLVPSDDIPVRPCNITLNWYASSTKTPTTKENYQENYKNACQPQIQGRKEDSDAGTVRIDLIILLLLLLATFAFFIGILVYLRYNYKLVSRKTADLRDGWERSTLCSLFIRLMTLIHLQPASQIGHGDGVHEPLHATTSTRKKTSRDKTDLHVEEETSLLTSFYKGDNRLGGNSHCSTDCPDKGEKPIQTRENPISNIDDKRKVEGVQYTSVGKAETEAERHSSGHETDMDSDALQQEIVSDTGDRTYDQSQPIEENKKIEDTSTNAKNLIDNASRPQTQTEPTDQSDFVKSGTDGVGNKTGAAITQHGESRGVPGESNSESGQASGNLDTDDTEQQGIHGTNQTEPTTNKSSSETREDDSTTDKPRGVSPSRSLSQAEQQTAPVESRTDTKVKAEHPSTNIDDAADGESQEKREREPKSFSNPQHNENVRM